MDLVKAEQLALNLMYHHSLTNKGWRFQFDSAKRRFGCCKYHSKVITLSKELTSLNDETQVKDTILHEIAHALVGAGHGHNRVWQRKAIEIGCNGKRCYSIDTVVTPKPNYIAVCPGCNREHKRMRRTRSNHSCGFCSNRYDERYKLNFKKIV
jgi:hypothetical protein